MQITEPCNERKKNVILIKLLHQILRVSK